jgi:uncharacterized protein
MNHQEREALQDFLEELVQARVMHKDREAESMIYQAIAHQPDAPYLLVQRNLLQEQALDAAQREIAALRNQINHTRSSENTSFLDSASSWGNQGRRYAAVPVERHPSASTHYGYARGDYPYSRPGLLGGGSGSFLGSMAATAAGVAAGSFLFHGIDELLHDHDGQGAAGLAEVNEHSSHFMEGGVADMGGLAGDAGIGDIGGMEDYS